jgi:hypothetical protein
MPPKVTQRERLDLYTDELVRARHYRDEHEIDASWTSLVDLYAGRNIFPDRSDLSSEDRIKINIAFSTINVMFPSISVRLPKMTVTATEPSNEDRAVFVQSILNFYWDRFHFHDPMRKAVKDSLIVGHGWVKALWVYQSETEELSDSDFAERFIRMIEYNRSQGIEKTDEEVGKQILASREMVKLDRPNVERVSPHDMYVNPEATNMGDARWVAQRLIRHIDEVRDNTAYSKAAREAIQPGLTTLSTDDERWERGQDRNSPELCEIWEFYDLAEGQMCVFGEGHDKYLVKPREMPYAFGHPFEMIRNYEVPEEFYPMGDLEEIEPLVKEISKTRSEMMNHRTKYARKYVARASALGQGDEQKLMSKEDGVVILVENDSVPLDQVVQPVQQIGMDPGLYAWSDQIFKDIQEVSGVSEFQRGTSGNIRRTATEAALIQDALNARSADKLASVEQFISNISRKVLLLCQQFLTGNQVARIAGRDGQQLWLPYTRDDIIGEYDFKVEGGSTQPTNESFRRQNAMALASVAMPFIQLGVGNPQEVFRHLLKEGFGIRNPEKFLQQAGGLPGMAAQQPSPGQGADAPQPSQAARRDADVAASDQFQAFGDFGAQ